MLLTFLDAEICGSTICGTDGHHMYIEAQFPECANLPEDVCVIYRRILAHQVTDSMLVHFPMIPLQNMAQKESLTRWR